MSTTPIRLTEHDECATAAVRRRVPRGKLTEFFASAFQESMAAIQAQGRRAVGPPFGKYHGIPDEFVDVEAGFPVDEAITATGDVIPGTLPGGRVVEATHVGPTTPWNRPMRRSRDSSTSRISRPGP